ncbi:MAG: ASKHA domain-containing protein [Candidatus Saccharicenans sp.]|nr:ASKHA domain-containing protein [Candidatus Saccharicenans sp.]
MAEVEIRARVGSKTIRLRCRRGQVLSQALLQAGQPLRLYCEGRGVCGQCLVRVSPGRRPEETPAERKLRLERKLPAGYRLACQFRLTHPVTVWLPENLLVGQEIKPFSRPELKEARKFFADFNPLIKKYSFNLSDLNPGPGPGLLLQQIKEKISALLARPQLDISPPALNQLAQIGPGPRLLTAVVYDDKSVLDFEAGDTITRTFGLAIDLGTTTISVELLDLLGGKVAGASVTDNRQAAFGADLISRAGFALEKPENLKKLRQSALSSVENLVAALSRQAGIRRNWIYAASLAGNTVMNHLFLGLPVESLGRAPFRPLFLSHPPVPAAEAGLEINPHGLVYLSPNLGSFVGGDIAAGLVYTGLIRRSGNFLYLDLGTNGEIVLKKGKMLLAASTAAGPAFEGGGISCGQRAVDGAIEEVKWQQGRFVIRTIGGKKPTGLCGSALLGVLAESLKAGLLAESGRILKGRTEIPVSSRLSLTQIDIRKLQLAIAAVKSGTRLLLKTAGLDWTKLDGLFLAGVFGNSVDLAQCLALGLLPPLPRRKIFFVGNASLAGARLLLLSRQARQEVEKLPDRVEHLSLAGSQDFQSEFLKALALSRRYWRKTDA